MNSTTNFDCFNQCLQKADCVFASRLSEVTNNCYLFKDLEMDNSTEPDAEYIRIIGTLIILNVHILTLKLHNFVK